MNDPAALRTWSRCFVAGFTANLRPAAAIRVIGCCTSFTAMETNLPEKAMVLAHCRDLVAARISSLEAVLAGLAESVANETKSTAGDKYETARAMLHIEQDQVRRQLAELRDQSGVLAAIDETKNADILGMGSLFKLGGDWYFLSTALGKLDIGGTRVFALSLQSPLGAKLRGLRAGESLSQNGRELQVEAIR